MMLAVVIEVGSGPIKGEEAMGVWSSADGVRLYG